MDSRRSDSQEIARETEVRTLKKLHGWISLMKHLRLPEPRSERETAVRISQEIGNLMKEIETLVEEKTKESLDVSRLTREGGPLLYEGISLTMNSKLLNGSQRVVMDGVISDHECQELQRLTNVAATSGDGYRGQTSPHTPNEKFYGVTVFKALKLGQEGKVPLQSAHLYYNVTEKVRRIMESYFRLDTPLYFSYSHLVCRTAIEEVQAERKDDSHPVHVDNCILNAETLVCVKEPPAYTFRDYSAILYLNGDFDGGNFYFTELDAKTVTAEVQPQCGRAVGFSSGTENPHGVKAVTRGQRCAIALWFTLDPRHSERVRAARAGESSWCCGDPFPERPWFAFLFPKSHCQWLRHERSTWDTSSNALSLWSHCLVLPGPAVNGIQDRVQADDLVKMLFSPEEMDLSQEQPLDAQQGPPEPAQESLSGSESKPKDEL
ncbi:prolyl 3-hydroxylase 1 isoform X4 [Homo sapiens]|uniref:prolyl 3-hydroxylase 1 isoform X4 n=1 Tax=Homo sapiens TaxID=9606 RepID=UPI001FB08AB6|nr:prolyl 3-hydroxylase 1 isoform X4 [Homo sapiens]XP_054194135.1 prolyl 3-hydroxylase 1 isoform X4 [Homo sapiens]